MDYAAQNGKKFIWAFGGWSDLTKTISDDQVGPLVDMLVTLLERHGGDGIDFDWEHLSKYVSPRGYSSGESCDVGIWSRPADAAGTTSASSP